MVQYNVQPDGVSSVLKTTGSTADGLSKDLQPLSGEVTNAANACGKSGAIVSTPTGTTSWILTRAIGSGQRYRSTITATKFQWANAIQSVQTSSLKDGTQVEDTRSSTPMIPRPETLTAAVFSLPSVVAARSPVAVARWRRVRR